MSKPKVSVVMTVYNGEMFLSEAVESILQQTFKDFEFIIINDGSTDRSIEILKSYKDPRIKLVENEANLGIPTSANKGIELARGEYIARMDCDDISDSNRFKIQIAYMDANPEIGICGTWFKAFGAEKDTDIKFPVTPDQVKCFLLFNCYMSHSSILIRRQFLERYNLRYNTNFRYAEDYELFTRCSRLFPITNIDKVLSYYRWHNNNVSVTKRAEEIAFADLIRKKQLEEMGVSADEAELELHHIISVDGLDTLLPIFFERAYSWFIKLLEANKKSGYLPHEEFKKILGMMCYTICTRSQKESGRFTISDFLSSPFCR